MGFRCLSVILRYYHYTSKGRQKLIPSVYRPDQPLNALAPTAFTLRDHRGTFLANNPLQPFCPL